MEVGDLCDIRGEIKFEWKIRDFCQLSEEYYESPEFSFCELDCVIWIYPNRNTDDTKVRWISLYLELNTLTAPTSVDFSFHFKTVDGKADTHRGSTHVFDENSFGWGWTNFIKRSKLIKRSAVLLPSGILSVICTVKKNDSNELAGLLKLQQYFKDIFQNGSLSDVVLKVDDQEFKSHRCVLARSPVFLAMMTHDTEEKNTGVVKIKDIDPNTISDFLSYLYTGSVEIITLDNVVKLYIAADKYQVDDLKKNCLDYMLENISVDNFCDVLCLSLMYVEKSLTDACSQFFIEKAVDIISTPKWLTFLKENPVAGNELYIKQLKNNMKNED